MKREVWPKILRLVLNVSQFFVTIVCVLAVVVISSPYPPNPLFSFCRGLAVVLIVYLLINRPVREIALGFVKGWRSVEMILIAVHRAIPASGRRTGGENSHARLEAKASKLRELAAEVEPAPSLRRSWSGERGVSL